MTLSALVYSVGGVDKNHLIATSPGPILIADTEGSAHKLRRPYTNWDVHSGTYPAVTKDSIHVVVVESIQDMERVIAALHTPEAPWCSFWINSFTVYGKIAEDEIIGQVPSKDTRQDYKRLLKKIEPQLITLKHIGGRADRTLEVIGATAWQRSDKVTPQMAGAIDATFDQVFDLTGQVSIIFNNGKVDHVMHIAPVGGITAKAPYSFYEKYGERILNPNFTQLNEELSHAE